MNLQTPASPILCLYPAATTADQPPSIPPQARELNLTLFQPAATDAANPAWAALRACALAHPGRDVVLLAADAPLPPNALARLLAAVDAAYQVHSPSSNGHPALDPFINTARPADGDDADACLFMLSERELVPVRHWLPALSHWRGDALAQLPAELPADGELPPGWQGARLDHLYVGASQVMDAPKLRPDTALLAQDTRLAALEGRIPVAAGRDDVPVMLHLLHGWGGGVQRFVEDLMRADTGHRHLALVARGTPSHRCPGEVLELYDDLRAAPLLRWPLTLGIEATALASHEYDTALGHVLARHRVSRVLVSSLIGHGLSALRTGLPTALVCHDYYPLWPSLHVDFGDRNRDFSVQAMAADLARPDADSPFGETRAEAWQALRDAHVAALLAANATLIAPSHSVRDNIQRIEPRLSTLPWHVIPHGLADWPAPVPARAVPQRDLLRVLVLGRINGGKGEDLLAELVTQLPPDVELVLLGAGRAGMRFFGQPGVHVRMDYEHAQLPELVAQLAPDLALIAASVAETFSYALSELWSLEVPVLATRIGSLGERIDDGKTGLLVAADAAAIATRLRELQSNRSILQRLHSPAPVSLAQMAAAYAKALPVAAPVNTWPTVAPTDPIQSSRRNTLANARTQAETALLASRALIEEQQTELVQRADWAAALQAQLDERTEWAQQMEADIEQARADFMQLDQQFEERTHWALSLQDELADSREESRQLGVLLQSAVTHGDAMQRDRDAILASRSWRLTRPLRYAQRQLSQTLARLRFRWQRLLSLRHRMSNSLRTRGLRGTLDRVRQELRPAVQTTPIALPAAIDAASLVLPASETPLVSIVIPVYNHLDATLVCLQSLAQTKNRSTHEIILVDDCSSDDSATVLPGVKGLRYQRNAQNTGFIGACNAGAANARGQFVVFLNNDTAVQDGWLDALIDTFKQHRDVGLVGAKLVYPDGRLQEAGGIVFSDGSGWNYGRFDDPAKPEYNFVREVDYCSGAAIALRTDLFRQFGGFDPYYAPAYYEDTDLAMKVRAAGLRVLYQPASVVVHFEGISSGTDTGSGTKRYQVVNKEKFFERWKEALARHPNPAHTTPADIVLARQHRARKHVLVIDATTPQPDHDSGSLRLCNILRLLCEDGHAVTFFADNRAFVEPYSRQLQQLGVEVLWHPHLSDPVTWFAQNGKRLDLVIVSRHYIASSYADLVRLHAPRATLAFDTVDLHYLREQRAAELAGSAELARTAAETREKELALIHASDVTLVVSPVEKELLAREAPGARVEILSNVHEVFGRRRGFDERSGLMFVGGYQHPPNVDAAIWFAREILPLVRAELPQVQFHLIGSKAPAEVKALGELPGVVFHGFVPEIEPFMDDCRLAVAPLRYGAGVKGKVNMSMSYGQPVVATPIAVEGMFAQAGRDVLVAETPEDFAAHVVRAYQDPELWTQLSDHGLANVARHFSFDSARQGLRMLL